MNPFIDLINIHDICNQYCIWFQLNGCFIMGNDKKPEKVANKAAKKDTHVAKKTAHKESMAAKKSAHKASIAAKKSNKPKDEDEEEEED